MNHAALAGNCRGRFVFGLSAREIGTRGHFVRSQAVYCVGFAWQGNVFQADPGLLQSESRSFGVLCI
jgi:hypothetical protein